MKRGFDIKQELSGKIYDILDAIQSKIRTLIEEFLRETIASITAWDYIAILNHSCRYVGAVPRVPALSEGLGNHGE
jgi:hypothetical protein